MEKRAQLVLGDQLVILGTTPLCYLGVHDRGHPMDLVSISLLYYEDDATSTH